MFDLTAFDPNKALETVGKVGTGIVALIGLYVTVSKFLDQRKSEARTARIEAQKPYTLKRQEVYLSLVEATAVISNRYGQPDWDPAFRNFWIMFWGVLPMVADEAVARAVDHFADTLDDPENGVAMRNASMDLARACRTSLGEYWKADLKPVEKSRRSGTD